MFWKENILFVSSNISANTSWDNIQARLVIARYAPRTPPVLEFLENIFKSSSNEKTIIILSVKLKINAIIMPQTFFVKTKDKIDKASSPITKSKNLYPPIFLNICGAIKSAKIEMIDPMV